MGQKTENTGFLCAVCGARVVPVTNGSYRNHCPMCLHSIHVDVVPGDRLNDCGGVMEAVALRRRNARLQLVHRCRRCGARRANRVAEGTVQPDSIDLLVQLDAE